MDRREFLTLASATVASAAAGCIHTPSTDTTGTEGNGATTDFETETVADGLTGPWGIDFLDGSDPTRMLVTELPGRLRLVDADGAREVAGVPEVRSQGQGGLLDVTLHPDHPEERWVYLTYSASGDGGSATHLGRGRLDASTPAIDDFEVLHVAKPFVESENHYGSRVVFGDDGMLYMTSGDRQFKDFGPDHVAQDLTNELGAVLRLAPDGSVPEDNPFVDEPDARDPVYSYGHRNPQGLTVRPDTGALWESEHGERDGDEINVILEGRNYGWPVATEACQYGTNIPVGVRHTERDDVTGPAYVWGCGTGGFPPAGMTFYTGDAFPEWRGDLFVGNLAGEYLGRLSVEGEGPDADVTEEDPLLADRGWRVRDVAEGPDGLLYLLVDGGSAPVVRLTPV